MNTDQIKVKLTNKILNDIGNSIINAGGFIAELVGREGASGEIPYKIEIIKHAYQVLSEDPMDSDMKTGLEKWALAYIKLLETSIELQEIAKTIES